MKHLLWLICTAPLWAHDPITTKLTWTREISRLIDRRCIACHGATAAVALMTYEQARPWAKAIRDQVMTRQMPPWGAVPGFGPELAGDPSLTAAEIDTIIRWVEGGAPEGDKVWLVPMHEHATVALPMLTGPLLEVPCEWRVPRNVKLLGLRVGGGEKRLTLTRADGSVEPLLWTRGSNHDFVFVHPIALSRGDVLEIDGGTAALALSPPASSLRLPGKESRKQIRDCPAQSGLNPARP